MGLTTEQIAARTGLPLRTVQYRVRAWLRRGYPRVTREAVQGHAQGRYIVDAAEYEAMVRGEITEAPAQAA